MSALKAIPIVLVTACCAFDRSVASEDQNQTARLTGLYRNEGRNGQPETARITDGKSFTDISEKEYRERGYSPPYEHLWTRVIRRLPVQIPLPNGLKE
ncbi:hypothetical protein [Bradyrhizobium sp. McL0616]|uniref:hypothetical protein n=1 Tax=Bradyrhizobium sp. McL0616 TaxID=3415674 RepID=UPI003CE957B2